jgi:threonine dehydrogenase-like Zn-dependent dehydrogenase
MKTNLKSIQFTGLSQAKCESQTVDLSPPPGGALIRTRYSCISAGTELAKLMGRQQFSFPAGIGNRAIGRVEETGPQCQHVKAGDLVFAHTAHASQAATDGLLVKLPDELDTPETALIGMASVAITGVRVAQPELGDTAVVLGAGLVGQLLAQLLAIDGVRPILVDGIAGRLEVARSCGIENTADPAGASLCDCADIVFDCTGVPEAIIDAPKYARKGAQIVLVGSPRGSVMVDPTAFLNYFHLDKPHGDLTLRGAHEWKIPLWPTAGVKHSQAHNIEILAELIRCGRLKLRPLLSGVFAPEKAQAAYDALACSPQTTLGAVFDWTKGEKS